MYIELWPRNIVTIIMVPAISQHTTFPLLSPTTDLSTTMSGSPTSDHDGSPAFQVVTGQPHGLGVLFGVIVGLVIGKTPA